VRQHRDSDHRGEHEADREGGERPDLGPQLLRRRGPGRRVEQWRQEDEEDDLRLELEVRQAREHADRQAAEDEHDGVRHRDRVRDAHQ
jgi:hypothetical protein